MLHLLYTHRCDLAPVLPSTVASTTNLTHLPHHLPGTISDDVIKAAFKKVAMQLHPDKNIDAAPALAARNRERFVRAQVAYDTLKDPERRRAYDRGQLTQ